MQRRLQQRRNEYVVLPTEMSPVAQGAKALVAMMGWSKPPASLPSETLLPPRSTIGPTEKEDPRQPSDPIGLRAAVGKEKEAHMFLLTSEGGRCGKIKKPAWATGLSPPSECALPDAPKKGGRQFQFPGGLWLMPAIHTRSCPVPLTGNPGRW
jgi:hypothetical protein